MAVLVDEFYVGRIWRYAGTLGAGLLGAVGNWHYFEIAYGTGHLFGSLFVLLSAALFGPLSGVCSAVIASAATVVLWGQPFSAAIFCLEAAAVAWMMRGRFATPLNADIVFWIVGGIPLTYLLHALFLREEVHHALTQALLQGVSGIVNALMATLCLLVIRSVLYRCSGSASCMISARMLIFALCALVLLMSGVFVVAFDLKRNSMVMERVAVNRCTGGARASVLLLDQALQHCQETLDSVARDMPLISEHRASVRVPLTEFEEIVFYDRFDKALLFMRRQHVPSVRRIASVGEPVRRSSGAQVVSAVRDERGQVELLMQLPYYREGVLDGTIAGRVDAGRLVRTIRSLSSPFDRQIVLLNEKRQVVLSSDPLQVWDTVDGPPPGIDTGSVYRVAAPGQGMPVDTGSWGAARLRAELPLQTQPEWRVVVDYSYAPLVLAFEQQLQQRMLLILGLLVLALVLAELLSRLFTLPLRQFEMLSTELAALGESPAEMPVISGYGLRELQRVADLFSAQSARIKALFLHQQELNQELEKDVANRTAQLHLLGDNLPKGVMFKAQKNSVGERQFVFLSRGFERIFGLSADLALADFNQVLQRLHPDDRARLLGDIERTGDTQLPLDGIYRARRLDGGDIWVRIVCATRTLHDGSVIWEGVMLDDTERARDEELLQESCKKAEELIQAKSRFLATMSHEIRTPLSAMMGTLELFEGTQLSTEQRTYLHDFRFASEGLLQIINDLLDYSKIEAGKLTLAAAPFALEPLIRQMAVMFRPIAERKGLQLIEQFDNAAAADYLLGDQYRLRQIMANLLSNAIKFTTHGQVQLAVQTAAAERNGTIALLISVRDSGIGIPADKQAAIFNQFEQVDSDLSRTQVGTGLGLSICARLAELMQSTIAVESEPGQGSCFSLRLCLEQADVPKATTVLRNLAQRHGQRLVLVEDDEMNRMVVQVLLEREGHTVLVAEDGLNAVQLLKTHQVDLVLTDISMPGMNGLDLLRAIRSGDTCVPADIPVVALTGYATREDRDALLAAGFSGCSAKPFSLKELQASIIELCDRSRTMEAGP